MANIAPPYLGRERLVCVREGLAVRVDDVRSHLAKEQHCEPLGDQSVSIVPQRPFGPNRIDPAATDSLVVGIGV